MTLARAGPLPRTARASGTRTRALHALLRPNGRPAPPRAAPTAVPPAPRSRRGSALPPIPGRARRPSPARSRRRSGRWRCASRSVQPARRGQAGTGGTCAGCCETTSRAELGPPWGAAGSGERGEGGPEVRGEGSAGAAVRPGAAAKAAEELRGGLRASPRAVVTVLGGRLPGGAAAHGAGGRSVSLSGAGARAVRVPARPGGCAAGRVCRASHCMSACPLGTPVCGGSAPAGAAHTCPPTAASSRGHWTLP